MFDFLSVDALLDLTHVSRRMAQINLVYVITLFLCRLISDDCYKDYMTVDVYYCGGCVPLFVTIRY